MNQPSAMPGQQPPLPGQQPPLPGQLPQQNKYNQLNSQMQGMNLNSPRQQYPGGPVNAINGDGPHMPPPLSQQQGYPNGQQYRGPPGSGYPGQGPMAGGYPQGGYPQQQKALDPDQMPSPVSFTRLCMFNPFHPRSVCILGVMSEIGQ